MAVPQQNEISPPKFQLLDLPGELRNHIFKLALTNDDPLMCTATTENGKFKPLIYTQEQYETIHASITHEKSAGILNLQHMTFNQLKFVNRQLYNETNGLELQINTIRFSGLKDDGLHAADDLFLFRAAMAPNRVSWLKRVTVKANCKFFHGDGTCDVGELMPLLTFCNDNPYVEFRYAVRCCLHTERCDDNLTDFFTFGALLWIGLRDDTNIEGELIPAPSSLEDDEVALARTWRTYPGMEQLLQSVRNFAAVPNCARVNEKSFHSCYYGLDPRKKVRSYPQKQQAAWLKFAKLWYEEGIRPGLYGNLHSC
ncbi:hypothetical protein N0V90_002152 [Kalmusia sp. IMI 367209]|nr:hypothetical protein N0V90_002152 [Kalmusia sp. IMI 367209]